jgi:hypothetical protein
MCKPGSCGLSAKCVASGLDKKSPLSASSNINKKDTKSPNLAAVNTVRNEPKQIVEFEQKYQQFRKNNVPASNNLKFSRKSLLFGNPHDSESRFSNTELSRLKELHEHIKAHSSSIFSLCDNLNSVTKTETLTRIFDLLGQLRVNVLLLVEIVPATISVELRRILSELLNYEKMWKEGLVKDLDDLKQLVSQNNSRLLSYV